MFVDTPTKLKDSSDLKTSAPTLDKHSSQPSGLPSFPRLIDVFAEIAKGNFLPLPRLLRAAEANPALDLFQLNPAGFNLLQALVYAGQFPLVRELLRLRPAFREIRAREGQTNLMIAVNQPCTDVIEHLLAEGPVELDAQDRYGFTVHFYVVRNNAVPLFVHLAMRSAGNEPGPEAFRRSVFGAEARDANGCGLVHWAAHRDALFLLQLLFRFGADLAALDAKGSTPFDRAMENNAVRCALFLARMSLTPVHTVYFLTGKGEPQVFDWMPRTPHSIVRAGNSRSLRGAFEWKRSPGGASLANLAWLWQMHSRRLRLGLRLHAGWTLACVVELWVFAAQHEAGPLLATPIALLTLLALPLLYLTARLYAHNDIAEMVRAAPPFRPDVPPSLFALARHSPFPAPHRLLGDYFAGAGLDSFLGEDAHSLAQFDSRLFCPVCLVRRSAQARHVWPANLCVPGFQLYSQFFGKIVFARNVAGYLHVTALNAAWTAGFLLCLLLRLPGLRVLQVLRYARSFAVVELLLAAGSLAALIATVADLGLVLFARRRGLTRDQLLHPQAYAGLQAPRGD